MGWVETKNIVWLRSISELPDLDLTWTCPGPGPGPELDNKMKVSKENLRFHPMQESEVEHIFNMVNECYR